MIFDVFIFIYESQFFYIFVRFQLEYLRAFTVLIALHSQMKKYIYLYKNILPHSNVNLISSRRKYVSRGNRYLLRSNWVSLQIVMNKNKYKIFTKIKKRRTQKEN